MNARGARHGYCPGDGPFFLKGEFPHSCPKSVTGKVSSDAHRGSHSMTRGARPHMSYRLTRSERELGLHLVPN
jgi:hypothetical protein